VHTPEQLEAWITAHPAERERLERGGYGTEFTAADLLPLVQVFIVQAGGAPPVTASGDTPPRRRWLWGVLIAIVIFVLMLLLAPDVFPAG
jgi:hypothetical protein